MKIKDAIVTFDLNDMQDAFLVSFIPSWMDEMVSGDHVQVGELCGELAEIQERPGEEERIYEEFNAKLDSLRKVLFEKADLS